MLAIGQYSFAGLGRHYGGYGWSMSAMMKLGDGRILSGRVLSIRRLGGGTVSAIGSEKALADKDLLDLLIFSNRFELIYLIC